tara:strand:- start:47 stop:208 length:162 start_codon:yes stop_codon:yes gene_type:complete
MSYQLNNDGSISLDLGNNSVMTLPPENNGTPEWAEYLEWVAAGNTPEPADSAD